MTYEMHITSADPAWARFNIFLTLVGYDAHGVQCAVQTAEDRVRDVDATGRTPMAVPAGGKGATRKVKIAIGDCARAEAFVSVVAHSLPHSTRVDPSAEFEATLTAFAGGRELFSHNYVVNPWGGLSIAGLGLNG